MSRSCTPAHVRSATLRTQMHYADAHYALGKYRKIRLNPQRLTMMASNTLGLAFIVYSKAASFAPPHSKETQNSPEAGPVGGVFVLKFTDVSRANRSGKLKSTIDVYSRAMLEPIQAVGTQ